MTPIAPPQQSAGHPAELDEGQTGIPSGWAIRTLGDLDVATIMMGQSPLSSTYNRARRGLPFFQGKTDFGQRFPTPRVWCSAPVRVAEPADVLISVRAPVGAANLALETCCIRRGIAAVRAGPATTSEFLFYWFVHNEQRLDAMGSGAIFRAINKHVLASVSILLPPLSEQRAIAALLTSLKHRSELEASRLASLRTLKAATMAKLFREGLRDEPLRETEAGAIPHSWACRPLGDLLEIAQYGLSLRGGPSGRVPILRMNCQDDSRVRLDDLQYVDLDPRTLARFRLDRGDLLFNRTNSFELVGRTAIFDSDVEAVFASYLIRLRTKPKAIGPRFLNYYLNLSSTQQALKAFATRGVSQSNISASKLKRLQIPMPPLAEQQQIADHLDCVMREIALTKERLDRHQALFTTALSRLMTGTFRLPPTLCELETLDAS